MSTLVVLHQGAIGDFLLTLSVVQGVRQALGVDRTTAVAAAPSARLAAGRSAVDEWRSPETLGLYRLFCRDLPLDEKLADLLAHADYVLSFLGGPAESVHDRLMTVSSARLVSVDPRPTPRTREQRRHITEQWSADVRAAGWKIADPGPARIGIAGRRGHRPVRLLIQPGSGGRAKCWPLEKFVELVESLPGFDATWMLGPAEAAEARRVQDRDESLLVETDLLKAAEQMASFDLYLGNDSGVTHLAAAIGLPTVAVFGVTDPRIWRPLGEHVTVVAPDQPVDNMDSIDAEQVRSAVRLASECR